MTTDSQFNDRSHSQLTGDLSAGMDQHTNESTGTTDMVKRDRFELLSAYLDGEVTATERRQVEEWLANDASVQCLYARLLKLRQGLRTLPVPDTAQSPEVTAQKVFSRLSRRSRLAWTFGGAAVAACFISVVSGLLPGSESRTPQLAQKPPAEIESPSAAKTSTTPTAPLMVAINNPVIEIPKAAVTTPESTIDFNQPELNNVQPDLN
ncbi:zf-HC2 domain-containing protein [Nostoc sp. FACHB-87]|uniref:anti-sigma factor family protein n=1 Tax=Nostocales TaxID=1161 RepID=UPI001687A36B|nr:MULTISPECIES: zf-HC2 domain-containing protein [Nostocales]MBD2297827.1 zf-HC2 domain-containing protein [Nostoc sp. FACHB-190]MBD2454879.1 zf-HC2 domain-containing protein [Nostoc sp. FACHB-87]MBD2476663.1 zf-HC2 domain-containing protein [Anabaena sp. FACHB-83]MBD2487587.1 zf-HC2 domain-containing protein [Aulosira sp. FACHB-615]